MCVCVIHASLSVCLQEASCLFKYLESVKRPSSAALSNMQSPAGGTGRLGGLVLPLHRPPGTELACCLMISRLAVHIPTRNDSMLVLNISELCSFTYCGSVCRNNTHFIVIFYCLSSSNDCLLFYLYKYAKTNQ